jgi:hypothetical protein
MNPTYVAPKVNAEVWSQIIGFEGLYSVSTWGRVKSHHCYHGAGECILKPQVRNRCGHLRVSLYAGGRHVLAAVHRLVLTAFVGPCPDGMECRHLDGNPSNNRIENLVWGTQAENQADRIRHGTSNLGERNGLAKLTEANVREIRKLLGQGVPGMTIGRLYGVSQTTISYIKRKGWSHVQ